MPPATRRIIALDALRGVGVLGILAVHVQLFAMPLGARSNPTVHGPLGRADVLVWLVTYVLADGKFIAIFAMLFGAGIVAQAARYEAVGLASAPPHYRRMGALLVLGLAHAYLLWYGDMLVLFSLCGMLVFLHRDLAPTRLIVAGVLSLCVVPLASSVLALGAPEVVAQAQVLSGSSADAVAREVAAYRGGWLAQQAHRAPTAWEFHTSYFALRGVWETSGLMLLGMGLFKMHVLGGQRAGRTYSALAAIGFGLGVPLMLWSARRNAAHGWDIGDYMLVGVHLDYWGDLLVGLGWVGAVLLVVGRGIALHRLVAVGRTALSNYVLQTLCCTTVFYGHGLGLFASVDRVGQLAIVTTIWIVELIVSPWWLGRFTTGPLEWVLRWATAGRPVPMRAAMALDDGGTAGIASRAHRIRTEAPIPDAETSRRVVVKFLDGVSVPYEDDAQRHVERLGIGPWAELARRFPGIRLDRLFTVASAERLRGLVSHATVRDARYRPSNLLSYFAIAAPADVDAHALADAMREWKTVETAYVDPLDESPGPVGTNPQRPQQRHLKPPAVAAPPAPQGAIDAEFAWTLTIPGVGGAGQKFVDLERGAKLDQEDIAPLGIAPPLFGLNPNTQAAATDRVHGARVLSVVAGVDNDKGGLGIAYHLDEVRYTCQVTSAAPGAPVDRPNAVLAAIEHFTRPGEDPVGRVLLLEVQIGPANDLAAVTDTFGVVWNQMPMETAPADFEVIRLATALGIVVVEAAGNGGRDLDLFREASAGKFVLSRSHPADFKDSGAIMVGGSTSTFPYRPIVQVPLAGPQRTNFGTRIDTFAWSENVHTYSVDPLTQQDGYASTFGGSSAASAIVAGAALLVQGMAQAQLVPSRRLHPEDMRALLSDAAINTPSVNPAADKIGVMPNLRRIWEVGLSDRPDVYLRDHVGDDGALHTGTLSQSPDIIVRPALAASPLVTFGAGTESDPMLGPSATSGQDNFVYVRAWNRAAVAATNVTATVFYAEPSTMLTGDLWHLVGSVVIGNVPANNVMTVSGPITWHAADVPAPGHYCFIALLGNALDPAPTRADFLDFDYFCAYIRNNNNVAWRNFDVVAAVDGDEKSLDDDSYTFDFTAPGAPDSERAFTLAIGSRLPPGSRVWLEAPLSLVSDHPKLEDVDKLQQTGRVAVEVRPRATVTTTTFLRQSRWRCRLLVQVPRGHRGSDGEVFVAQVFEDLEVGRITWGIASST